MSEIVATEENQHLEDKQLVCVLCGRNFTWAAGEQKFYKSKGFQVPTHCPSCRAQRRKAKMEGRDR